MFNRAEFMLCNLLAVIHRDGGQYTERHGLEKSVADAMTIVSWDRSYVEAFHRALDECDALSQQDPRTGPSSNDPRPKLDEETFRALVEEGRQLCFDFKKKSALRSVWRER